MVAVEIFVEVRLIAHVVFQPKMASIELITIFNEMGNVPLSIMLVVEHEVTEKENSKGAEDVV